MILSILLVCAVAASLALGVLLAYTLCLAMFAIFRVRATRAASARVAALRVARN